MRGLEGHQNARVVNGLRWHDAARIWAFEIELKVETAEPSLIPAVSRWFFVFDERYPHGGIKLFPAKDGGIDRTFPHQNRNGLGHKDLPWRTGDICLHDPSVSLRRAAIDPDPKGQLTRFLWYIDRAVGWLEAASRGELLKPNDHFELPQWPTSDCVVGFSENEETFSRWSSVEATHGPVELAVVGEPVPFAARRFLDHRNNVLIEPVWGRQIREVAKVRQGAWLRLPSLPVIPHHAAPRTWGELFQVAESMGVDLEDGLARAIQPLRDGKRHVLMIGFPIPRLVGQVPSRMHWQPMLLPELSRREKPRKGFRATSGSQWLGDRATVFAAGKTIEWMIGRNWHTDELASRGLLSTALREQSVTLLGGGALGSHVAETLIRGGLRRLTVIDSDVVAAGNLVRHTLAMSDVGRDKAEALVDRLNSLSPHADARAVSECFPRLSGERAEHFQESDLVIDCTGSDDVLHALAEQVSPKTTRFVTVGMGRGAKRLYLFSATGTSFPMATFQDAMATWLTKDSEEFTDLEFPWEGIGCWHPVFPASADRVALYAAATVRYLDRWIDRGDDRTGLVVYELDDESGELRAVTAHA